MNTKTQARINELKNEIAEELRWGNICHEVMLLKNGNLAIAILDVVDDWGSHLCDASEAEDDLIEALGVRETDCDEEVAILEEMGLEDSHSCGWEETWRVCVLEL